MKLLQLLGFEGTGDLPHSDIEGVRTIVDVLRTLAPERARHLAAFAYILSRIAHVDQHVCNAETTAIERIVVEHGKLPESQAKLVVDIAKAQSVLFGGSEDFLVTREFATRATHEEKLALLHCLFAVSSADETIAAIEDNEIRRIARELRIEHADYIAIRMAHKHQLGVLRSDA
jgi:uncharacterized tellurite resistance protein B-like protein